MYRSKSYAKDLSPLQALLSTPCGHWRVSRCFSPPHFPNRYHRVLNFLVFWTFFHQCCENMAPKLGTTLDVSNDLSRLMLNMFWFEFVRCKKTICARAAGANQYRTFGVVTNVDRCGVIHQIICVCSKFFSVCTLLSWSSALDDPKW